MCRNHRPNLFEGSSDTIHIPRYPKRQLRTMSPELLNRVLRPRNHSRSGVPFNLLFEFYNSCRNVQIRGNSSSTTS